MAYTKQNWVNDQTVVNAEHMNHIEDGVKGVSDSVDTLSTAVSGLETAKHTHSNKTVLDSVTSAVVSNSHSHTNKTVIDKFGENSSGKPTYDGSEIGGGSGTVTSVSVKMNNTTKGTVTTSGTIDLGKVITEHQDISGKQDKLTAGDNISINGNVVSATDTTYSNASLFNNGLMSSTNYKELKGIENSLANVWDSVAGNSYNVGDIVFYADSTTNSGNGLYVCIRNISTSSVEPETDTEHWARYENLAQKIKDNAFVKDGNTYSFDKSSEIYIASNDNDITIEAVDGDMHINADDLAFATDSTSFNFGSNHTTTIDTNGIEVQNGYVNTNKVVNSGALTVESEESSLTLKANSAITLKNDNDYSVKVNGDSVEIKNGSDAEDVIAKFNSDGLKVNNDIEAEGDISDSIGTLSSVRDTVNSAVDDGFISRNLFSASFEQGGIGADGSDAADIPNLRCRTPMNKKIFLKAGTYTVNDSYATGIVVYGYSSATSTTASYGVSQSWHTVPYTFTLTNDYYVRIAVKHNNDEITPNKFTEVQLEKGSTATSYTEYAKSNVELTNELANIGDAWTSRTYSVGEYAICNNTLWKCLVANSVAPSEGANWHKVTIASELKAIWEKIN